jgi:RHS repeat-associated protein
LALLHRGFESHRSRCMTSEHHFTGKERGAESGLDYFGARYYSSNMGRFLSPDPGGMQTADIEFPQSLNRYAYVWNNPLRFTDPTGLDCAYLDNSGSGLESFDQSSSSGAYPGGLPKDRRCSGTSRKLSFRRLAERIPRPHYGYRRVLVQPPAPAANRIRSCNRSSPSIQNSISSGSTQ